MGRRFRRERFGDWKFWYKRPENGGVIGNSRIIPHRYLDEGDKGKQHRREIKRREERLWRKEAREDD